MRSDEAPEARFYKAERAGNPAVRCLLCPHVCLIPDGGTGLCRARHNDGGTLRAAGYGIVSSLALDPIEKKPLAHFFPGSRILSVGGYGCNLSCKFCQNHEISQRDIPHQAGAVEPTRLTPLGLVEAALFERKRGNIGIAYTYNEPFVGYEFVFDAATLARGRGLKNVLVTNGYVNGEPLAEMLPLIDAMNIDLKSMSDSFYRRMCGGRLSPVMETIETAIARYPSCHVEVTTLVIPDLNSSREEIGSLAAWLASISPEIPLHLSRHHPDYLMPNPEPISRDDLFSLADLAREHLSSVHCGNV